jgi:hypothetical protein
MGPISVFGMQRWPLSIATAWVLTRERRFVEDCAGTSALAAIEGRAADWRRNTMVNGQDLHRRPVMLFPSAEMAALALRAELNHDQWDYSTDEVLQRFPGLGEPDWGRATGSVWRGQDPNDRKRIPLSHAAWWVASQQGSEIVALDDRSIWSPAFKLLLQLIVDQRLQVFAIDPSPAELIDYADFDLADAAGSFPIDFPVHASEGFGGSPYRPGRGAFIACDLLGGDSYYAAGQLKPVWSGMQVPTNQLLKVTKPTLAKHPKRASSEELRECVDDYCRDAATSGNATTQVGLEKYASDKLPGATRTRLRNELNRRQNVILGRPRKKSPKEVAEK